MEVCNGYGMGYKILKNLHSNNNNNNTNKTIKNDIRIAYNNEQQQNRVLLSKMKYMEEEFGIICAGLESCECHINHHILTIV